MVSNTYVTSPNWCFSSCARTANIASAARTSLCVRLRLPLLLPPPPHSTRGSYTNASSSVSSVSRPRRIVRSTCSQASRNIPCKQRQILIFPHETYRRTVRVKGAQFPFHIPKIISQNCSIKCNAVK